MTEAEAMNRALSLALKGWGRVSPNPLVGAVLLRDGTLVGEGYHAEFGGRHAEVAALESCPDPAGTTCVVNLEPCNHHGKTPPCTEALISAGVRRAVIAIQDPHPDAAGGVKALEGSGIEVELGLLCEKAAALNAAFLWSTVRQDRPFLAVKLAVSLDGYLADAEGRSRWISGPEAREYVHWLRAGFDAIGVGRRTAQEDDPELTVRGPVTPRVPPARVVFSASGRVKQNLKLVESASQLSTIVVTSPEGLPTAQSFLRGSSVQVISAERLMPALRRLRELGLRSLLVEGGAGLVAALLAQDLVDRVYLIQAPIWLGSGIAAFTPREARDLNGAPHWVVTERQALGGDTLLVVDRQLCLQG